MADNHFYPATGPNAGTVRLTDSTVPGSAADDVMGSMDRLYDLEQADKTELAAEIAAHTGDTANPHATTAAQVGAYTSSQVDTALAGKADASALSAHTNSTSNPHSVTKSQVGLGNVQDVDQTNASNILTGTLSDDRLSDKVPLLNESDELVANVIVRKGTESAINAIVLAEGEFAYTTDTKQVRAGDGVTSGGNRVSGRDSSLTFTYRWGDPTLPTQVEHQNAGVVTVEFLVDEADAEASIDLSAGIADGTYEGQQLTLILRVILDVGENYAYGAIRLPDNYGGFAFPRASGDAGEFPGSTRSKVFPFIWLAGAWRRNDGLGPAAIYDAAGSPTDVAEREFNFNSDPSGYSGNILLHHGAVSGATGAIAIDYGRCSKSNSGSLWNARARWKSQWAFGSDDYGDGTPGEDGNAVTSSYGFVGLGKPNISASGAWMGTLDSVPLNRMFVARGTAAIAGVSGTIAGKRKVLELLFCFYRGPSGNVALLGSPTITTFAQDAALNTWTLAIAAGTTSVNFTVSTGAGGQTAVAISLHLTELFTGAIT